MKIVDLTTFLQLPEGAIYAKSDGTFNFQSLHIKGDSFGANGDWWYFDPCCVEANDSNDMFDRMAEMLDYCKSYPMDDAVARDGLYDKEATFLVFEKTDLIRLRDMIDTAIAVS